MYLLQEKNMKDLTLIVWLTQLGLSVAVPMAGFVLLAVWLRNSLGWGQWVIYVGIGLGLISYTMIKIFSGKFKEVSLLTYVISALFLVKFFLVV